ncbi:hypothetical protein BLNAU_7091 [Blattamonas nauphoetae]|uniref:Uncharacterized protein n=1 Tax=Blattamonas nauphoetae TaxID=2049346 RepID=A0ABQ9Y2E0_9EUKA|nr:hypothetical protein BLNAU_7091 [Blattamonas nauphoetae]
MRERGIVRKAELPNRCPFVLRREWTSGGASSLTVDTTFDNSCVASDGIDGGRVGGIVECSKWVSCPLPTSIPAEEGSFQERWSERSSAAQLPPTAFFNVEQLCFEYPPTLRCRLSK